MNRRIFLRGLGGAVVAAPFLSSLGGRGARAQAVKPASRLIVMFTHNGCITTRFFPAKSHGALTAADLKPTSLAPLSPYVDKLLIPRGIRAMNEWTSTMIRGQGNDYHTQVDGSYFTCQPVTPNSNDPFSFDAATKFQAKPVGPSLDHVIAKQLSPGGTPLFIRVGNRTDSPQSAVSYSAATTSFPGIGQVSDLYTSLTGLFPGGEPLSPDSYQAARGKSVLDLVRDDLATLERIDMSASDKLKVEAWKSLLEETGTVMASAQCREDVATALGVTPTAVNSVTSGGSDTLTPMITDSLDGADVYSALAVLAAVCNANPVIFLKYPQSYIFKGLGVNQDSTTLSGRLDNASLTGTCVTGAVDMLLSIDRYYAQKFAKLIGLLNGIPEGDGTSALDNSAAVWFQEYSDGAAHNLNNLPIVQAGSAGGYFRTGCTVNVEDGSADLSNGNSEGACTAETSNTIDGISQMTGTDPTLANAPINKYYCNLMNAVGVKAGGDGFPAPGGSEEVTKFGMYDRTEDFIGGGTNPPMIHSPGGFDALKANA